MSEEASIIRCKAARTHPPDCVGGDAAGGRVVLDARPWSRHGTQHPGWGVLQGGVAIPAIMQAAPGVLQRAGAGDRRAHIAVGVPANRPAPLAEPSALSSWLTAYLLWPASVAIAQMRTHERALLTASTLIDRACWTPRRWRQTSCCPAAAAAGPEQSHHCLLWVNTSVQLQAVQQQRV